MRLFVGTFTPLTNYRQIKEDFSFLQGRWVPERNLHLTLLFLGEVRVVESIRYRLSALRYDPIQLSIEGLGFFGSPPRILFARVDPTPLEPIHTQLCHLLDRKPDRPFRPHITLARIRQCTRRQSLLDGIRNYEGRTLGTFQLRISLIESQLTPKGPIYTPLATF
ncbi:MAG: RNA 2',3'-cyclic phosphodiesterase [Nitratiruptor sp.]|nr:RNA 2',3'-cyclic phosphodiesterase [Nitratiruptor sp.]NPA83008.1 RNA 2',3'-cyclic phosphodiesterase [Campylobacterota bacterium]